MSTTIQDGGLVTKDPADVSVYAFDWDNAHLAATVTIATSTWTITAIRPNAADTALTKDNEARLTAAQATTAVLRTVTLDNRVTQVRLSAGTLGGLYQVTNTIVTSESPTQTKERSFRVLVQNK